MNNILEKYKWHIIFLGVLILSQANIFINFSSATAFLGLPLWIWFFALVQVIFCIALYFLNTEVDSK